MPRPTGGCGGRGGDGSLHGVGDSEAAACKGKNMLVVELSMTPMENGD